MPNENEESSVSTAANTIPITSDIDDIDLVELSAYLLKKLQDDLNDRESFGWIEKRDYDNKAYSGLKRKKTFPWKNCSNYASPLTTTLVDTGHSNVIGSMFSDKNRILRVNGIATEDVSNEKPLELFLNWLLISEINIFSTMDITVFKAFKNGMGIVKVIRTLDGKINVSNVPFEDLFMPLDAKGFRVEETDHVFQSIGWTEIDLEQRKQLRRRDGTPIYINLESLERGYTLNTQRQQLINTNDRISGTSMSMKEQRDLYYVLECYFTYAYYPKGSAKVGDKKIAELVATISPKNGEIFRVSINNELDDEDSPVRPYGEFVPYPRDDRFPGQSLPEKIRFTQEELDYSHNQNIDAADIAISPPGFYPSGSDFDPEVHQLVPGGMYPITNPGEINWRQTNVNPIFERQEDKYWDLAERLTGLTELFQGRQPTRAATLGEAVLRTNRSEIRFGTLYRRFEEGFARIIGLIYHHAKQLPKETKIKVLGTTEFRTIESLFPEGIQGKFDYMFSSSPITEREEQKTNAMQFYSGAMANPLVQSDPGNIWRVMKIWAEELGIRNFETVVKKPSVADTLTAEEAIQTIMAGNLDIVPDPSIDTDRYVLKIQLFMRTEYFKTATAEQQNALILLLRRASSIQQGKKQLMADMQILRGVAQQAQIQQGNELVGQNEQQVIARR